MTLRELVLTRGKGVKKRGGSLADVICVRSLGPHLPPQEYKDGRVGDDGDDERHVERTQCRVRLCRCGSIFQSYVSQCAHSFVALLLLEIRYLSSGTKIGERAGSERK